LVLWGRQDVTKLGPQVYKHLFGGILFVVTTTKTADRIRANALLRAVRRHSPVRDHLATELERRVEGARRAARNAAVRPSSRGAMVPKI
jgi:hypothetical protein